MARLQNSYLIDNGSWHKSIHYKLMDMHDKYHGMQNLAEEEAYQRHLKEMENKNDESN
jgi:hypothetical protein